MKKGNVFIYVNANNKIGSGHFWRCLTIANELRRFSITVQFVYTFLNDSLIKVLTENSFVFIHIDSVSAEKFVETIHSVNLNSGKSLLITDTDDTHFYEAIFQQKIVAADILLMTITVNPSFHYYAHILFNQNIIALGQNYSSENYTRLLFGPEYFIYAPRFRQLGMQSVKPVGKKIFVAFGSADPYHYTFQLLEKILKDSYFNSFCFHVVVGAFNNDYEKIKELSESYKNANVYYNSTDVASIMLKCDLALCAPGLMFWELTLMGVHSILFSGSEREKFLGDFLDREGYAYMFQHYDESFDDGRFQSLKKCIADLNFDKFINFQGLRKKINPDGVHKLAREIDHILS